MKLFKRLVCFLLAAAMLFSLSTVSSAVNAKKSEISSLLNIENGYEFTGSTGKVEFKYASVNEMYASLTPICKNDNYELRYCKDYAAVAIKNFKSGEIYTTNPFDASLDPLCVGDIEKGLESQIELTYLDTAKREQIATLFSSSDCVELGQFSAVGYENGIKVSMKLGKDSLEQLAPTVLSEKRYNELYNAMSMRGQGKMEIFYTEYSYSDSDLDAETKVELAQKYPSIKKQKLYIAIELSDREKRELQDLMTDAGYTLEQMHKDYEALGAKTTTKADPVFKLDIEYILTDYGLKVNIPSKSISYDTDTFQLLTLKLLQYFGSDKPEKGGDGYLFYPDGSGAVININNQDKNRRSVISSKVYGFDAAMEQDKSETEGEQIYLPVYGIRSNNGSAFVAIVEQGDAVSEITAKLGNPNSEYFTVYNTFTYSMAKHIEMDAKVSSLSSSKMVYLYEKNCYSGNFTVGYRLLSGDSANYSGMAAVCREYYRAKGMEQKQSTEIVNEVQTIGSSLYKDTFLGFTYNAQARYTKFTDDRDIIDYFKNAGIHNLKLSLYGWQKYGLDATVPNKLRVSGVLGGKGGLNTLLEYSKTAGVSTVPKIDMLFCHSDRLFDGYSKNSDSVRRLDSKLGGISDYDYSTAHYNPLSTAISPKNYSNIVNSFFKGYKKLETENVSLSGIGTYLNSDFNKKTAFNRSETMDLVTDSLKNLSGDYKLSFDGANAYVLPFADSVSDIPVSCSEFVGESYSVPFLQMVLSGSVSYNSKSINVLSDSKTAILRCIESGTAPSYIVVANEVQKLKNTIYNKYYSVNFEVLKSEIAETFKYVNDSLKATEGTEIIAHSRVAENVFCTEYANGAKIYVNYGDTDYKVHNTVVKGGKYAATA